MAEIEATFVKINEEVSIITDPVGDLIMNTVKKVIEYSDELDFPVCDEKSNLCITEEQFIVVRASLGTNPDAIKVVSSSYLSDELNADLPGEAHFYVESYSPRTIIQTCRYGDRGDYKLMRERIDAIMKIYDIQTGRLLSSKTIIGDAPPVCTAQHTFSGVIDYVDGGVPNKEPLYDWLRTLLD